jgi:hypothetical protein
MSTTRVKKKKGNKMMKNNKKKMKKIRIKFRAKILTNLFINIIEKNMILIFMSKKKNQNSTMILN